MTLTEIKNQITWRIGDLTIDDFYATADTLSLKKDFLEIVGLNLESEIEPFLIAKIPETSLQSNTSILMESINQLQGKISDLEREAKSLIEKNKKSAAQKESKIKTLADIPEKEKLAQSELIEIENEIMVIRPLKDKPPYNKQIKELERRKEEKEKELAALPALTIKLQDELKKLDSSIKSNKVELSQIKAGSQSVQDAIANKQNELEQLDNKEEDYFENEYASLQVLFNIVLCKNLDNHRYGNGFEAKIYKRGNDSLLLSPIGFNGFCEAVLRYTDFKNNPLPDDWRNFLHDILSGPLPPLAGTLGEPDYNERKYLQRKKIDLDLVSRSFLLALKSAVLKNTFIVLKDGQAILALSGGFMAQISFRKKGKLITTFQQDPLEIFGKSTHRRMNSFRTLYHQAGYASSQIQIEAPLGFYMLTDKFIVEIDFDPAPILFDNNGTVRAIPNISGKAKREDEIEAEEKRRKEEEDWYD